jgi:prepilin-type N-terminal cleavage/methylation domain-containing protein
MKPTSKRGFTLVEIMIVVAIIALLAAIAIPNVLRGRTSANESAAVGNLRALVSSLEMYRSTISAYPDDWDADMYGADCAVATLPAPDFGPPSFCIDLQAGGTVQGYDYAYTELPAACDNTPGNVCSQYQVLATPDDLGRTGTRSFFVDESGTIRHCVGTGTAAGMVDDNTIDQPPTDPCT